MEGQTLEVVGPCGREGERDDVGVVTAAEELGGLASLCELTRFSFLLTLFPPEGILS